MLKQIILGVATTAALGMGTAVLADGFYVSGQVGYGWNDGKSSTSINGLTVNNMNVHNYTTQSLTLNSDSSKSRGVTGRLAVGYNFDPYIGIETGFSMFQPYYRTLAASPASQPGESSVGTGQTKTSLYAADLLARATLPIGKFFTFVEGGGAYVYGSHNNLRASVSNSSVEPAINDYGYAWGSSSKGYIRPKAGVGVGYNLTDNVAVNVSYDRIFATGKNNLNSASYIPNINTAMVGLTYKF